MSDPHVDRLAVLVAQVRGLALWFAALCTSVGLLAGACGLLLWGIVAAGRLGDGVGGTSGSLLVLLLLLAPGLWLLNVRVTLKSLVELPAKLGHVVTTRVIGPGESRERRPEGGAMAAARSIRRAAQDYGEIIASRAVVAQIATPSFWVLTGLAYFCVPILVLVTLVAALVNLVA